MEYIVDGHRFSLSYAELKEHFHRFADMTDGDFLQNLPAAAHLACIICFLKEIPTYVCLSDKGIIHELIHLMHIPDGNTSELGETRKIFNDTLKLY